MSEKKIVEYQVLSHAIVRDLNDDVNASLKKGWTLYGPVSGMAAYSPYGGIVMRYFQALVKYEEENKVPY